MITQKQIEARDECIKAYEKQLIEWFGKKGIKNKIRLKRAITNADKEAAGVEDEMLNALITINKYAHISDDRFAGYSDTIYIETKTVIEHVTGLTIDEAIKVWEAKNAV